MAKTDEKQGRAGKGVVLEVKGQKGDLQEVYNGLDMAGTEGEGSQGLLDVQCRALAPLSDPVAVFFLFNQDACPGRREDGGQERR